MTPMVAHVSFDTTEHENEDIEAAIRLWSSRNGIALHAHLYWPEVVETGGEHDWQALLHRAKCEIDGWEESPWRHG